MSAFWTPKKVDVYNGHDTRHSISFRMNAVNPQDPKSEANGALSASQRSTPGTSPQQGGNIQSTQAALLPASDVLGHATPTIGQGERTTAESALLLRDEYKCLREEMMHHMRDLARIQMWAVVGAAAIYTWLAVNMSDKKLSPSTWRFAWFIAPVIITVCCLRGFELLVRMKYLGGYLLRIEEAAFPQGCPVRGWEHHKLDHRGSDLFGHILGTVLWIIAVAGSFGLSWWLWRQPPTP